MQETRGNKTLQSMIDMQDEFSSDEEDDDER